VHLLDPHPQNSDPVLLLHGLGADATSWALQIPVLAQAGFRPIAPDAPGFGASRYDGRGWTTRRVAAQLAELLRGLSPRPAHVVGLSMGGVLAQQFAHDHPELTRKLVLVSSFAVLRPDSLSGWLYFLQRAAAVLTRDLEGQAHIVAGRVFPGQDNAQLRDLLVRSILQSDPRAYRGAMRSLAGFDSRRWLSRIEAPTLVISGELDTTVSPLRQRLLGARIPGARLVVVAGAGHAVPVDQAESFNRLLLEFLAE